MAHTNGNLELYDGNILLIDALVSIYEEERHFKSYVKPSSEYAQYNAGGPHVSSKRHFDGNVNVITNANGNHPKWPYEGLTYNGAVIDRLLPLDTWPDMPNENLFVFRNDDGFVDFVVAYPHDGSTVKYHMFSFNDNKYRLDPKYNLRWATKFLNASIPNRPAVPPVTAFKQPSDPTLELLSYEKSIMLRGDKQLYKINGKYYDKEGMIHHTLALASKTIQDNVFSTVDGSRYKDIVPNYLVYEPTAEYDSYGINMDIHFTYDFKSISLKRNEYELKGPLSIQGKYYWCSLIFSGNTDNVFSTYDIVKASPIDIKKSPSRALLVVVEHNKELMVSRYNGD